jgi:DNA-binding NtrC family response regulator
VGHSGTGSISAELNCRSDVLGKFSLNRFSGFFAHVRLFSGRKTMGSALLVVDDEDEIRQLVGKFLESMDLTVYTAGNGIDGIAVFNQHRDEIAVLVTDVQMPRMDGVALVREILRIKPSLKVIVASSFTQRGEALSGNIHFLQKPYGLCELWKLI